MSLSQPSRPVCRSCACLCVLIVLLMQGFPAGAADEAAYAGLSLPNELKALGATHPGKSGAYIFDKGEEALLARAWLTDHAGARIEVQYFIWSSDNIGILAAESLLRAAERGVSVRVLVDDLLIDAPDRIMVALDAHPNIQIRIYNPQHSVGVSGPRRLLNLALGFRSSNQRMHDKSFTVDGAVSIIGGRNMADEYFDYNSTYNFRDRDVLLLGPVVADIGRNFETFWNSDFAIPVAELLSDRIPVLPPEQRDRLYTDLHAYARDPVHFEPAVRQNLFALHHVFPALAEALVWDDITFTHDLPGKNDQPGLSGGGATTAALIEALSGAGKSVLIQSPYLVLPEGGVEFFKALTDRGVEVTISTNSLASTDNLQAFSGYFKQRQAILDAGIRVFEFQPTPAIQRELIERYEALEQAVPTFAIHAKSMVIDHELLFVGTFNLDPRSANLNTEIGILVSNPRLAARVEEAIRRDILPENSWNAATDNPDRRASIAKRLKVWFWSMLPLEPLL